MRPTIDQAPPPPHPLPPPVHPSTSLPPEGPGLISAAEAPKRTSAICHCAQIHPPGRQHRGYACHLASLSHRVCCKHPPDNSAPCSPWWRWRWWWRPNHMHLTGRLLLFTNRSARVFTLMYTWRCLLVLVKSNRRMRDRVLHLHLHLREFGRDF